jgi:hypothetical protein
MASYFLRVKHVSRGKGARVTRAAAYRAGERIRDERTSEVYNFSNREDVAYKEIVLPSELAGRADMDWTQDRSTLWNAAEHAGRRRNSRLAREVLVLLPPELTPAQRTHLVRTFSRELADKYRGAVDLTIHEPRPGADRRNHHAHLLMTTREVTPKGLGPRTTLELGGRERHLRGLGPSKADYSLMRERWAQVTNEALRAAGVAARIDHRSFKDRGINREPTPTTPEKVFYAEQRSRVRSQAGDAIRARHRERVEARLKGGDELARVLQRQKQEHRERAIENLKQKEALPKEIRWSALTREERNQKRRERYKANREIRSRNPEREAERREANRQRARAAWRENGEAIKEQRRQWRKANAAEVNRKQREYRKACAEREAAKGLSTSQGRQAAEAKAAPESMLAKQDAASFSQPPPSPTAEESVRNWLAYRESHKPGPTAAESAKNWMAFRESQKQADPAQTAVKKRSLERGLGGGAADDADDDSRNNRKKDRSRDNDFGL